VATLVAPEGARAASAGTFIVYASHIAAMAPATNLGAATPVAIGMPGRAPPAEDKGKAAEPAKDAKGEPAKDAKAEPAKAPPRPLDAAAAKAVEDAAAFIRGLALLRGRNADFAERSVREALSLPSEDALKVGVIDLIAADVPDLLRQIDGRTVALTKYKQVTLALAAAKVERIEPDWRTRALAVLSNPTVAMVLLMIGVYGLFFEFTSPGFGVPGVAGAISLLLAMYGLHMLPVNWVGVVLLLMGAGLMVTEVFVPRFGVFGIGGIVAFVAGGMMLIEPDVPGLGIPLMAILIVALTSAALIIVGGGLALRARKRAVVSGVEEMVGATGTVFSVDAEGGWADIHGERWRVRSAKPLAVGARVRVRAVDGLTLVTELDDHTGERHAS
jgi:membrane-bound serine protease (ClpP class)